MGLSRAAQLAYRFMELPVYVSFGIAKDMGLLEGDENPNDHGLRAKMLGRANQKGILAELWDVVHDKHSEEAPKENPYREEVDMSEQRIGGGTAPDNQPQPCNEPEDVRLARLANAYNKQRRNKSQGDKLLERTQQALEGPDGERFAELLEALLDGVCGPTDEVRAE